MNHKILCMLFTALLLTALFSVSQNTTAEEPKLFTPDKGLCAKMLRFGKQAYQMGRYLDAKEFFRKAIQADRDSSVAWRHYDMAAIFALAEKVKKNADLIAPGVSVKPQQRPGIVVTSPLPPKKAPPSKGEGFKIEEDEGC